MPTVQTVLGSGESGAVSDHTITLSSGLVSGNLAIAACKIQSTDHGGMTWKDGAWKCFGLKNNLSIAYKDAVGSDSNPVVRSASTSRSGHLAFRIDGHADSAVDPPEGGTGSAALGIPANYEALSCAEAYRCSLATAEREVTTTIEDPGVFTFENSADWITATIAIHPSGASSPTIRARNCSRLTGTSETHSVQLPDNTVNLETLIVLLGFASTTDAVITPSGWVELLDAVGSNNRLYVFRREADGGEGATQDFLSTGTSALSSHISFAISGAVDPDTQEPEATSATGTSATPNPPSNDPTGGEDTFLFITAALHHDDNAYPDSGATGSTNPPDCPSFTPSGGSQAYLWLAIAGKDHDDDATGAPTDYINLVTASEYEAGIGGASRERTASSEDPGAFASWDGSNDTFYAVTCVVYPAAGGISIPVVYHHRQRNF